MLVFGAGTDYALLLVARYREELRRHEDRHEAMAFALHRAAPAIVASAATVVLGMLCLLFAEMNSTAGLGPVAAIGIAVGAAGDDHAAAGAAGDHRPLGLLAHAPALRLAGADRTGLWARVGRRIAVRPRAVWVATAAALAIACLGMLTLDAHGLTTEDSYTKEFDSIVGQRVLTDHGLLDQSNPLMVVANADRGPAVVKALSGVDGLSSVSPQPIVKDGVAYVRRPRPATRCRRRRSTRSRPPARPCTPCRGRTPWSAATPRSRWTWRTPRAGTTWSSSRSCWSW